MVSFYCGSPSGFDVEFGCGGLRVDEATWSVTEITKPSSWGHR
jgi:3,4-dihydroxy-9,10-secoandrosta-1,3,5(10)-triene-9,17-dione 4,5-dioxygenase